VCRAEEISRKRHKSDAEGRSGHSKETNGERRREGGGRSSKDGRSKESSHSRKEDAPAR